MSYVFATIAGLCGAFIFAIFGTWLVLQVLVWWQMHQDSSGSGGVGVGSLNAVWTLLFAVVGFAIAFRSTLQKLRKSPAFKST